MIATTRCAVRARLGWEEVGYAGDGRIEMEMRPQNVASFFGLNLNGVAVPEEYD